MSLVVAPAVFVAVGAVSSQLGRTRRVATGLGMAVFAVTHGAADDRRLGLGHDAGCCGSRPFGWIERMRPYTEADWRPVGLAAVAVVVLGFVAVRLAGTRDVGAGCHRHERGRRRCARSGCARPSGLVVRGEAAVLIAWMHRGAAAGTFAFGIVAKVVSDALPDSSLDTLEKFGLSGHVRGRSTSASPSSSSRPSWRCCRSSQIGPRPRTKATGGRCRCWRCRCSAPGCSRAGWCSPRPRSSSPPRSPGSPAWLGAASQSVDCGFAQHGRRRAQRRPHRARGARPRGRRPRGRAAGGGAGDVRRRDRVAGHRPAGLAGVDGTKWLDHLSLFHYMALAPATDVDAATVAITLTVALALCALATVLFSRRDVATR